MRCNEIRKHLIEMGIWKSGNTQSPASYLILSKKFIKDKNHLWNLKKVA